MKAEDIIQAIYAVDRETTQKAKVARLLEVGSPELCLYLKHVKDPSFVYYMTKKGIPTPAAHSESHFAADFKGMICLLKSMSASRWTRPNTKSYVADWLQRSSESLRLLFTWAIDRKLPGNLGTTLINEAYPSLIFEQPYGGVAAWDADKAVSRFHWGSRPQHIQRKEDGMTLMIDLSDLTVRTRQGQNVSEPLLRYTMPLFKSGCSYAKVLHVEALMYQPDCATFMDRPAANGLYNKIFRYEGSVDPARMHFKILDCIDQEGFYLGRDNTPQGERHHTAKNILTEYALYVLSQQAQNTVPKITVVKQHEVMWLDDAREICQKWIRYGREGAIIKDPYGAWTDSKMTCQMKMKNEFETTLMVVGYKPHKRHPEWVGSLNCTSSDGKLSTFVGSGLNEEAGSPLDRRQGFEAFEGKLVEVKAEGISKNNALNLPRIIEVRLDKEFADTYDEVKAAEETSRGWR